MGTIGQEIEIQLRSRIASLTAGSQFSTDKELCEEFAVSRMTVYNVTKKLADEGLLVRNRRRGTFVKHPVQHTIPGNEKGFQRKELTTWMEKGNPIRTVFTQRTQHFQIHIEECAFPHRRLMWEDILERVAQQSPRIQWTITSKAADVENADLVLFSLRSQPPGNISTNPVSVQAIRQCCPRKNYFSPSWTGIEKRGLAACPFAVSTALYLWNLPLLQRHCPSLAGACPQRLTELVSQANIWKAADFPPVASFIFYPPIQWITEGLDFYTSDPCLFNLDNAAVRRHLLFSRHMAERVQSLCGKETSMNASVLWKLFNHGRLLAINTFSSTLAVMPPQRQEDYMVFSLRAGNYAVIVPVYLGLGRSCSNPEKAIELISLICGTCGQSGLVSHYGNIPALRQAAYSAEFLDKSPTRMLQVLQDLETSESLMEHYPFLLLEQPHFDHFARYMLGEIDLQELRNLVKSDTFAVKS